MLLEMMQALDMITYVSDDHTIPMVCMCVSCVGVQCNIP